jgi:hypothetical protein
MTGKSFVLFLMWLYVCKSAVGCQFSERYHVYDILTDPKEVLGDVLRNFL